MCFCFQFDSICILFCCFKQVSLISKYFIAFKAYILLLYMFSQHFPLTRVPVGFIDFTHSQSDALATDHILMQPQALSRESLGLH